MLLSKKNNSCTDIIKEFRYHIGHLLSFTLTDLDCLRFLHARQCSIERSVQLALKWDEWRHQLLVALPRTTLRYSPNIILSSYSDYFFSHPQINLLPIMHHGWDNDGRPILWVKLGFIQSQFNEILKHFSVEDLTQYHLVIMEMFELRYNYMYTQNQKTVTNAVVVFDMTGFDRVTLDMDAVWMLKSWIHLDQNYFPGRLHQLFIVNTPWYFSSLLGMFQPFIDKKTRKKIKVFQGDYLSALTEHMDISTIPEEHGGMSAMTYQGAHSELSGVSLLQIEAFVRQELLSADSTRVTTPEEEASLREITRRSRANSRAKRRAAISLNRSRKEQGGVVDDEEDEEEDDDVTQSSIYYSSPATSASESSAEGCPAPSASSSSLSAASSSPPPSPRSAGAGAGGGNRNSDLGIEMAYMSSVFKVSITAVENLPTHEEYVIDIEYDEKVKWQVRHRYSDFDKFRKNIVQILPPSARKILPPLPPKVMFGRRSTKVISERRDKLSMFLCSLLSQIRSEASFDGVKLSSRREEEHQLFLFLEAYKALQSYVEEADYTSDDEDGDNDNDDDENEEEDVSDDENTGSYNHLSFRDRRQVTHLPPLPLPLSPVPPHGGPLERVLHTRSRRISAALLSVCVLVLSLMCSRQY